MSTFAPACLGDCELQIELTQRRRSASTTHARLVPVEDAASWE